MMFSLSAEEIEVLKLSCQVAATCLAFSLIPALVVGWVMARKEFFGKSLFETFIFLPLVLPPVVPGYLLLQVFGGNGILGKYLEPFGLNFAFNWKGAVLASAVMGFPLLVQSIRLAIELVDQRLEMAAKTLGASSLGTFFYVGNIAGETRTLPLAMYSLMQQPDTEQAVWRLIILSLTVAFFALWFAQWFHRYQKKKRGH